MVTNKTYWYLERDFLEIIKRTRIFTRQTARYDYNRSSFENSLQMLGCDKLLVGIYDFCIDKRDNWILGIFSDTSRTTRSLRISKGCQLEESTSPLG